MDDFSIPGKDSDDRLKVSPPNYIEPGKRPLSSMTPTILLSPEDRSVKMAVGASGGAKITTAVAQVSAQLAQRFSANLDAGIVMCTLCLNGYVT